MRKATLAVVCALSLASAAMAGEAAVPGASIGPTTQPASAGDAAAPGSSAQVRAALSRPVPQVVFQNATLRSALEFIGDARGINLHANWKAIEAAGVSADAPVSMKLHGVPARKVLNTLLSDVAGKKLAWYIEDGILQVTSRAAADSRMFTIVYHVEDLLLVPPGLTGMGANGSGGAPGAGAGYGGGLGGGSAGGTSGAAPAGGPGRGGNSGGAGLGQGKEQAVGNLVDLIKQTVEPEAWAERGGGATAHFFNGNLIIRAPRSVHEKIGGPID